MSFDVDKYNDIPAQDCFGSDSDVNWFACTGTKPFPFMGCCAVNPCAEGSCPTKELRMSKLSSNEKNAQVFLGGEDASTTASESLTATSTSTTSSATVSETTAASSGGGGGLSQGAIIGIAVGATAFGILAIGGFLFWFWRRARKSRDHADATKGPLMGFGAGGRESSQFQDMKYQSQYSPNTASFQGLQSPQSTTFSHPNSPQTYHDRNSYHPGLTPSPGLQSPPPGYQGQHPQWAVSPPPEQQNFISNGAMQQQSPPAHVANFNMGAREDAPVELPASMTQQSSELSNMSELPANPNTLSVQSYSGVPGRESEVSGISSHERAGENRI
jgi:hypothetical protein